VGLITSSERHRAVGKNGRQSLLLFTSPQGIASQIEQLTEELTVAIADAAIVALAVLFTLTTTRNFHDTFFPPSW